MQHVLSWFSTLHMKGRFVFCDRPLNQMTIKCPRWHYFLLSLSSAFISKNPFSREERREQETQGDKDQLRKTSSLLWQLNSCCVWSELLIYGSKTTASYSRGAAERSPAEIKKKKSSFHQLLRYDKIQFDSSSRVCSNLEYGWPACSLGIPKCHINSQSTETNPLIHCEAEVQKRSCTNGKFQQMRWAVWAYTGDRSK